MSASPATILSILPQPEKPVPGDTFNDRILLLLAAVAHDDGLLTYPAYQQAQEACRAVFGEQGLHAQIQAKLHYALLHPPKDPLNIAKHMAEQAEAQKVSASFVESMLSALHAMASHKERLGVQGIELVREIAVAFQRSRFDDMHQNGLTLQLSSMYKRAALALPRFTNDKKSDGLLHRLSTFFTPKTTRFNESMKKAITELERVAWTIGDKELSEQLHELQSLLHDQHFRAVIVGERKRGKSSLLNSLLGQELSPVRESTPETATVVSFYYNPVPEYAVHYINDKQFQYLDDFLQSEQDNTLLTDKIRRLRQSMQDKTFTPGKLLAGITCWDELGHYISRDGRYANFVGKVRVGLPIDILQKGLELVDTPGLNDTDAFHDYLSYEESLGADCILFVMDAQNPGSQSELALLRRIVRSGRTVTIIGVLTNIDKLYSAASLEKARAQALAVLLEASRTVPHIKISGVVAINAQKTMFEQCDKEKRLPHGEFCTLLNLLQGALTADSAKTAYRNKVQERYNFLVARTRERLTGYAAAYRTSLPDPNLLQMLEHHASQLADATSLSLAQARQVVDAAAGDLEAWNLETERALDHFAENLTLRIMDAIHTKMSESGRHFAREKTWETFEKNEIQELARVAVEDFLQGQQDSLQAWEQKIELFSGQMQHFSQNCLQAVGSSLTPLTEAYTATASNSATHILVQTHHYMKNLAVFTTGAAIGRASVFSPLTLLISAGNILALTFTSPLILTLVAAAAGTAGFIYHLGREDKRRAAFIKRKRKETESYTAALRKALHDALSDIRTDLGKAYAFEVRQGFTPALESLFYQSMHMRLFLDVMHTIKANGSQYEQHVERQLLTLSNDMDGKVLPSQC